MLKGSLIITLLACVISSSVALPYVHSDGKLVRRKLPPPGESPIPTTKAAADPMTCVTDAISVSAKTLGTAQQAISGVGAGSGVPATPSKADSGNPSKEDPLKSLNQALESCGYTIVKANPAGSVPELDSVVGTVTENTLGGERDKSGQDTGSSSADTTGGVPDSAKLPL